LKNNGGKKTSNTKFAYGDGFEDLNNGYFKPHKLKDAIESVPFSMDEDQVTKSKQSVQYSDQIHLKVNKENKDFSIRKRNSKKNVELVIEQLGINHETHNHETHSKRSSVIGSKLE
jgi:hypothetical protein